MGPSLFRVPVSIFDYDAFADQFNTNGPGTERGLTRTLCKASTWGVQVHQRVLLRVRARHSNSRTGVPGEWDLQQPSACSHLT